VRRIRADDEVHSLEGAEGGEIVISLPALLALASAATKGPYKRFDGAVWVKVGKGELIADKLKTEDGDYFAALSPEVVTALRRVVEAAKELRKVDGSHGIYDAHENLVHGKDLDAALAPFTEEK